MHTHDFAEFFLLVKGSMLHKVNGHGVPLRSGDVVLMRPEDAHEIATLGKEGFSYVNVAFPADILSRLKRRYFPDDAAFWGGASSLPAKVHPSREAFERILSATTLLASMPKTRFHIERLLMNLLFEVWEQPAGAAGGRCRSLPDWMKSLCEEMERPESLKRGLPKLFKLAGRCKEHVCRSFKRHLGATPTDYVNNLRLQRAELLLLTSDMKVPDVASECGFDNSGHFHKVFKRHFGMTPRRLRVARRSSIA